LERSAASATHSRLQRAAILPLDSRAALAARVVVRGSCARWGLAALAETACACVSELAANAVRHVRWNDVPFGRRVVWLALEVFGPFLVVEVRDPDGRLPVVGSGIDWAAFEDQGSDVWVLPTSGLGLFTVRERVRECGGEFGAVVLEEGKSVFFALPVVRVPGARGEVV
jgi:hypothetical protein